MLRVCLPGTKSPLCCFLPVRLPSTEIGFLDCLMKGLDQPQAVKPGSASEIPEAPRTFLGFPKICRIQISVSRDLYF